MLAAYLPSFTANQLREKDLQQEILLHTGFNKDFVALHIQIYL